MKKLLTISALLVLAVPAAYAAPPEGKGKPENPGKSQAAATQQSSTDNAAKACKAERGTTADSRAAFREKYGTNVNKANAFGKCVSMKAKALEQQAEAEEEAEENAAKLCKAERGTTESSKAAFREKYGTNVNKANAFGKCVSKRAKELQKKAES
jgi:hypothetical protein